ncbi:hypothetical protein RRG08_011122 [Elysia crispata]|uniref:Uncharacterized protein n=1 Tax=Elysia crispata TaxID=231223 RepID=A0AAE1A2I1_9GAST|nr:hypothetical protein RRG08_011122 [Elysia crispata]
MGCQDPGLESTLYTRAGRGNVPPENCHMSQVSYSRILVLKHGLVPLLLWFPLAELINHLWRRRLSSECRDG